MKDKPLISIIINCFNSEEYLEKAIDSVIQQTYENWELIFWDNQSTDSSSNIVNSYKDTRIKYFYSERHTSLGEGRNLALNHVNGDFISFLDADDAYYPERLKKCLGAFDDDNVGLVYSNGHKRIESTSKEVLFYKDKQASGDVYSKWIDSYNVMIPSVMFRKKIIKDFELSFNCEYSMVEEYDFFHRVSKYCHISFIDEPLCLWRCHEGSLSWTKQLDWNKENKALLERFLIDSPEFSSEIFKFRMKIAKDEFIYIAINENRIKREIIRDYIFKDKRFFFLYMLSMCGVDVIKTFFKFKWKLM